MSAPAARPRRATALALLAAVLFVWAGVRATVMQAAMAAPAAPACHDMAMAGMPGMAPAKAAFPKSAPAKPARCEFCAAAAHAPLAVAGPRFDPPVAVATFIAYAGPASLGPRGPPRRAPVARGPPPFLSA